MKPFEEPNADNVGAARDSFGLMSKAILLLGLLGTILLVFFGDTISFPAGSFLVLFVIPFEPLDCFGDEIW